MCACVWERETSGKKKTYGTQCSVFFFFCVPQAAKEAKVPPRCSAQPHTPTSFKSPQPTDLQNTQIYITMWPLRALDHRELHAVVRKKTSPTTSLQWVLCTSFWSMDMTGVYACLFEAVCDVTTVPSHLNMHGTCGVMWLVKSPPGSSTIFSLLLWCSFSESCKHDLWSLTFLHCSFITGLLARDVSTPKVTIQTFCWLSVSCCLVDWNGILILTLKQPTPTFWWRIRIRVRVRRSPW